MKKIGLIALALVLSLGLLGVGLAQWTETLTINGSMATGELNVEFSPCLCEDNEDDAALGFDVGTCTCDIDTNPDANPDTDDETLVITISNAYPCYECTVDFDVTNTGSIPVDLGALTISGVSSQLDVTVSVQTTAQDLAVGASQVGQLTIHVNNTAAESSNYSFTATILATQFNAG